MQNSISSDNERWLRQLNQLQRHLEECRRQPDRPTRWSQSVWTKAARLARRLGVSRVSRTLGLSYPHLKERTTQLTSKASSTPAPAFVELALRPGPAPEDTRGYRAELTDGTGQRLVLHLGQDANAALALAQSFWRRRP
jgi:hypothetical protein